MKSKYEHNIDKLFHESLDGNRIDPAPSVWNLLSKRIPARSGINSLSYLAAALGIGLVSVLLNFQIQHVEAPGKASMSEITSGQTQAGNAADEIGQQSSPETATLDQQSTTDSEPEVITETEEQKTPVPGSTDFNIRSKTSGLKEETARMKATTNTAHRVKEENIRSNYSILNSRSVNDGIRENESRDVLIDEQKSDSKPVFNMTLENSYVRDHTLSMGAGFSPAVNIYPDGQNRNDFSFEVVAVYEKSRFFVEGGVGANYATESAKYGINYSTYDSIGYFINVDAFRTDPNYPDSVFFETSTRSVYDSIDHYYIQENTNKYAYLQIPLRIGYRVVENGRFSLDLKAGIIFSWQILKEVPDIPYQGSDAEQIEVIRHYPDRLKTNWQYTAGIGMNYHISNRLRLTVNPFYRQYVKSVYATDSQYSAQSPFAFGIRGGIFIEF